MAPVPDQIVARIDPETRVRYNGYAGALDVGVSELVRGALEIAAPQIEARAKAAAAKREAQPHGVTEEAAADALRGLLRDIVKGTPLRLAPHDLLSARSRALWSLLGYIWSGDPAAAAAGAHKS